MILHPIAPVYDERSKILILGSFPSVASRAEMFFYGHPQNRFWQVVARVFEDTTPRTVEEKRAFLLRHRIAVWDVLASCEIVGSADSTIRSATANDLSGILASAPITRIFVNGKTAEKYYKRYLEEKLGRTATCLPSTSPANAAFSLDKLYAAWCVIREE